MALLQVNDLRTWFHGEEGVTRAVDGVSFTVDRGETVGLVGESGSGKTVTALSIMGLVPEPPGRFLEGSSVRLNSEELIGASKRRLRSLRGDQMAMVFQEPMTSLNPVYPIGDQIAEALRAHRRMTGHEARERTQSLLAEVGISNPARRCHEYPHQFSGGMRQRVMIAMALSCEPGLLIADEPTTALDVTIQAQVLRLLADVTAERGMGVLLVTHDLGVVAQVCDRVVVMYAGQVVEAGSVASVFADPRHPYTRGLLRSVPRASRAGGCLRPIEGTVPSPAAWPSGCRFHERCPEALPRCGADPPPLLEVREGTSLCWLHAESEEEDST